MEATIGYIVIFGLGIFFIAVFLFRKDKKRILPISEQAYPQLIIAIFIKKEMGKISEIILQLSPLKKALQISEFHLELTNEEHDKKTIDMKPLLELSDKPIDLLPAQSFRYSIPFSGFETLLSNQPGTYDRFRFVVVTPENKKFKSHALALHSRWGLFKQDSGKYN